MNIRTYRPIPLTVTLVIATLAALAALAVSDGYNAHAHDGNADHANAPAKIARSSGVVSRKELALRNTMRRLWEDHIVWTRLAIISLTTGSPDTEATVGRLLANQADIGNAVKPFYGKAAGSELTRQLRGHILIAADLVAAAKAGDEGQVSDAQARWQRNADDIARLLNKANPRYWKLGALKHMLGEHLTLTTQEAVARLQANWAADVAAYDKVHRHALAMADVLSTGLVKQFPRRFR